MDPRLNPAPAHRGLRPMVDVRPMARQAPRVVAIEGPNPPAPAKPLTNPPVRPDDALRTQQVVPAAAPTAPLPSATEIVASIPVHQPNQPASANLSVAAAAPRVQMPGYDPTQPEAEDDLDKILKAVNNRVAAPLQTKSAKSKKKILSRVGAHAAKAKNLTKSSKPVAAMGVVIIVALMLCVVAVMAYRQGGQSAAAAHQPGKVGTSYTAAAAIQSAGGTLVRPNDLDDYSQTLEAKLNGLNDTQDFDAASLSDSVLGL